MPMRRVFILGTERSGSTWLANIFDSDSGTELIMEPFADYAHFFPGFPGRFCRVRTPDPDLVDMVRARWDELARAKYALAYRRGRPRSLRNLDRHLTLAIHQLARRFRMPPPLWLLQHELLNLNQAAVPVKQQPVKRATVAAQVTKELRLAFKSAIVTSAFPDARVIVPLRHPVLQVASILKLLKRGHLGELRRDMTSFRTMLRNSDDMTPYWALASRHAHRAEPCSPQLLACWWVASHATILSDLRKSGVPYCLTWNEEMSRAPLAECLRIMSFAGLPMSDGARHYIEASSRVEDDTRSPVGTRRDSSTQVERSVAAAPDDVRTIVSRVVRDAVDEGTLDTQLAPPPLEAYGPTSTAERPR